VVVEPNDNFFYEDGIANEGHLVSVCASIVTIQRESDIIGLVHYTAYEYMSTAFWDFSKVVLRLWIASYFGLETLVGY
jgi:hypothetical protein